MPKLGLSTAAITAMAVGLFWAMPALAGENAATAELAQDAPLHQRIDAAIDAAIVGPVAKRADDEEFVRRVWLDLAGKIPTAEETRRFLEDSSADKRERLIDRLLESRDFERHMANVLDLMFMERRERYIPSAQWQDFLCQAVADRKPIDQLVREIITADGADPAVRPAAKFFLDRECEPNLMTRDIGRILFGMDLQCAQCHDHPLVDDYFQEDYYGLYAFVSRVFLFIDTKDPKQTVYVAERAEGDVSYQSVFTGDADEGVRPRPPKQAALAEPVVAKGEEYVVKPENNARPVPKYSRRARLAESIAGGHNQAFDRNMANRLWAHMMGRGLVHPLDLHHSDNPPTHPEVLELVANEFVGMNYDLRGLLRELALTRVYQRSSRAPTPSDWTPGQAGAALAAAQATSGERSAASEASANVAATESVRLEAVRERFKTSRGKRNELVAALTTATEEDTKLQAAAAELAKALAALEIGAAAVTQAATASQAAAAALAEDAALAEAAKTIESRRAALAADLEARRAALAAERAKADQAHATMESAISAATTAGEELARLESELAVVDESSHAAARQAAEDKILAQAAARRVSDLETIAEYERLAAAAFAARATWDEVTADPAAEPELVEAARARYDERWDAARKAWNAVVAKLPQQGAAAPMKPLSPEQFAWSLLRAARIFEAHVESAPAEIVKEIEAPILAARLAIAQERPIVAPPLSGDDEVEPLPIVSVPTRADIERHVFGRLRGSVGVFASLYGNSPGQSQSGFSATINQALFFANSDHMRGWAAHGAGRYARCSDADQLAEELYLGILSRAPSPSERQDVADQLAGREDRALAIEEMVWALLASNEFRFNH